MDLFQLSVYVIIFLGFGSLYLLQKQYLKKYLNKKGENQANKEDIAQITKLIEDVKHTFTKDAETLKSKLSVLTNTQLNLISEERNAIVAFNNSYFTWYRTLACLPAKATSFDNADVRDYINHIDYMYHEMLQNEAQFDLFVDNDSLELVKQSLLYRTIEISNAPIQFLYFIQEDNAECEMLKSQIDMTTNTFERQDKLKHYKEVATQRAEEHKKLLEIIKQCTEIKKLQKDFQEASRKHIFKLLNG